jgi:hypothetical protein
LSTTNTSARPTIDIRTHGTIHLALRRISVKVFVGAINVSTMRSVSVRGVSSTGIVLAASLIVPSLKVRQDSAFAVSDRGLQT